MLPNTNKDRKHYLLFNKIYQGLVTISLDHPKKQKKFQKFTLFCAHPFALYTLESEKEFSCSGVGMNPPKVAREIQWVRVDVAISKKDSNPPLFRTTVYYDNRTAVWGFYAPGRIVKLLQQQADQRGAYVTMRTEEWMVLRRYGLMQMYYPSSDSKE